MIAGAKAASPVLLLEVTPGCSVALVLSAMRYGAHWTFTSYRVVELLIEIEVVLVDEG